MNVYQKAPTEYENLADRIGRQTVAVLAASELLVEKLAERNLRVTAVESCTGGALSAFITAIPGSSVIVNDGLVTYCTESKVAHGVPKTTIDQYSVYSTETAVAMARAGLRNSVGADIGIGITGSLSRPDPNNSNSIPGEVHLGIVFGKNVAERTLIIPEENRWEAKMHIVQSTIDELYSILG